MALVRRRNRGFTRAGQLRPDQIGLPRKRVRELRLGLAWREVAGPALSRRARAVSISRGTLTVELIEPDESWARTIADLLPELAGRLRLEFPELAVRRCRLQLPDGRRIEIPTVDAAR